MSLSGPLSVPRSGEKADRLPSRATALHDARDLIRDGVSAQIVLDGTVYVLRITRAGKLILTK
jgi:hemin uptake protein HemP